MIHLIYHDNTYAKSCSLMVVRNFILSQITDGGLPETLKNIPAKFGKSDFYGYVMPVLSAFASYHTHLEFSQQQRLIQCLEFGNPRVKYKRVLRSVSTLTSLAY